MVQLSRMHIRTNKQLYFSGQKLNKNLQSGNIALITKSNLQTYQIMKSKKIVKTASFKQIDHSSVKRSILVICKTLQTTQFQQSQTPKKLLKGRIADKNNYKFVRKSLNKQKRTQASASNNSSDSSEFMPEKIKNKVSETKNISTSYGKMILRFIQDKKQQVSPLLIQKGLNYDEFLKTLQFHSQHMFSVSDLRRLWLNQHKEFASIMRIFSMNFLRKHSFQYIFNSRIKMFDRNLKYRHKIIQGVQNPQNFNMLKNF